MYALRSVRGGGPAIEKSRCGEIRNPYQKVSQKSHPALEEEDECPGSDGKQVIGADESGSQTRRRRCHGSRDLMCTHVRYFLDARRRPFLTCSRSNVRSTPSSTVW